MCNDGEVMNAALPSALKLASETKIALQQKVLSTISLALHDKEFLIVEALDIQPELTVSDIAKLLGQKTVMPILKLLFGEKHHQYIRRSKRPLQTTQTHFYYP